MDVEGCIACDLSAGRRDLPRGLIHETAGWRVEQCVGPLGIGTLLLRPVRHVTRVAELTDAEASAHGPLIVLCARTIEAILAPAQTYVCLWSHAGGKPGHIHYVIQPVSEEQVSAGALGPFLQSEMFAAGAALDVEAVVAFADQARDLMARADG